MNGLGKYLVILGGVLITIGLLLWSGFGKNWFGRLPGEIHFSRSNFSFHFPLATCLLISAILTLLFWLCRK